MGVDTDSLPHVLTITFTGFLFYLSLSMLFTPFEIVTGSISALTVGLLFSQIAFENPPAVIRTPVRFLRALVYLPYLCWEILKANVTMAYLILHPDLPIDARFEQYETPDGGALELSTLATSITLTPGTLITDIHEDGFEIHALTEGAWDGLLGGALEHAVGFIFVGRDAFEEPTPRERMDKTQTTVEDDTQ
ncbi:Na+/H+ antiporter subunit E [Haloarcula marina]|uniref:Na+/H+ antiporter subunit E n=1 Tax=Haloarcula marina TaxID=2961574 RepID=UPI0020B827C5|nr:Na+/H+ antiporter subunit E [Halomicroarcula marina]